MKLFKWVIWAILAAAVFSACSSAKEIEAVGDSEGGYSLVIDTGEEWLHEFNLFLCFNVNNPPQYAVWMEDLDGNYLETIAVTEKIAMEKWVANDGNRRVEALPYWVHSRGHVYSDGSMLPSGDNPMPDAVTTASAKTDSSLGFNPGIEGAVRIVAEFNHSMDYNTDYPEDTETGSSVSGQPSVVYSAVIELADLSGGPVQLNLAGHGSPDGSDGKLYDDCSGLTSALNIVDTVRVKKN